MLLLEDHSLDIPPFLQRGKDGALLHPGLPLPLLRTPYLLDDVIDAVTLDFRGFPPPTPEQIAATEQVRREVEAAEKLKRDAGAYVQREKQKAEKLRLTETKKAARRNFAAHFKWDWEK